MQTTKRYPRTMEEAFGPGHRGGIYEPAPEFSLSDKVILGLGGIIMFGLLLAILLGVI
jgi:hypothetical protein